MSTSKSLTASLAAAALVGTIGLAYAQTSDTTAQPTTPTQTTPSESSTGTTPATSPSTPAAMDNTGTPTERAPQADRN